jgi:prepilin-type N-terminal cleavage/methylation domain-containing protein
MMGEAAMQDRNSISNCRRGFTLIEMLVAIGILAVIATLSAAVIPKIQERTKASKGGDQIQGWLLIAKQRALRDRAPRGVRLIVDPDNFVRTLQYIERPDPITGVGAIFDTNTLTTPPQRILIPGQDLGGTGSLQAVWPVQPGDYIQLYGGPSYKIATLSYDPAMGTSLYLTYAEITAQNLPPTPITNYTITRQPRPIAGEDYLQLPDDVAIDFNLSVPAIPAASVGFNYDILFTPNGTLTGTLGDSNGKIILWVRDIAQDSDQPGEQPLIVVFCRTGRIGGFPSDPTGANPYVYVLDPRATGL